MDGGKDKEHHTLVSQTRVSKAPTRWAGSLARPERLDPDRFSDNLGSLQGSTEASGLHGQVRLQLPAAWTQDDNPRTASLRDSELPVH